MSASHDPYAHVVRYYDAENADRVDDIPFILEIAQRFGGLTLVAGCGTGRILFPLLQAGYTTTGIDLSAPMLARARARADQMGFGSNQLNLIQDDIRTFSISDRFDLIVFPYNGFMHLLTQADQSAALQTLAQHLKPDGALLIDVHNPVELFLAEEGDGLVLERTFDDEESGDPVMQQSLLVFDRAEQLMDVTWFYDRIAAGGQVFRDVIPMQFRITFRSEFELLLSAAGLTNIEIYGDYDSTPYEETSSHLILVARR